MAPSYARDPTGARAARSQVKGTNRSLLASGITYSVHNLTGKFAAVLGPFLWGTTLLLLDPAQYGQFAYQVAIGTLLLMVVIGLVIHLRTPNIERQRAAPTR